MRSVLLGLALCGALLAGCSSHGTLGIIANPMVDAGALLKAGKSYKELGYVESQKCRHFILAIIPFGDGDLAHAVYEALAQRGGDAILNADVETSLYGFIPIYNVYSFTCTTVKGIAIKFE
jgi:hypothetical protein